MDHPSYRDVTVGALLTRLARELPDHEALVYANGPRFTFERLEQEARTIARGLMAGGVERGERVVLWATNVPEWIVLQFALAKIGAILVTANTSLRSKDIDYLLRQSEAATLVTIRGFRDVDYIDALTEIGAPGGAIPALKRLIYIGGDAPAGYLPYETLRSAAAAISDGDFDRRSGSIAVDDVINMQYTSGTTGFPKGATLSHHNILNNGFFTGEGLNLTEQDRVCIPVPFYHCFGMVLGNLACTTHGACMVIPGEALDPLAVMRTIQEERCTAIYGTPTHFISELNHPDFASHDFSSLRTGIMAGAPCPLEVMKSVLTKMHVPEITICYGMTETSPVSTQTKIGDPFEKQVGTVGRVHPHVEIKVVDPQTGRIVPRGASGELCTRGYSVMLGYWNNSDATSQAIDAAHWMHTGDLAVMDEDGYCNIVGRIKDMIIRGGENVYPREIEEFLYRHPAVADVSVIGVPSEKYGEEVVAWVKLRDGATCTEEDLSEFCRGQIATYKIPRFWKFTDSFPMTVTGKIRKVEMREISVQELGRQQAALVKTA
jgi:fatty-acyl-CoA synthase